MAKSKLHPIAKKHGFKSNEEFYEVFPDQESYEMAMGGQHMEEGGAMSAFNRGVPNFLNLPIIKQGGVPCMNCGGAMSKYQNAGTVIPGFDPNTGVYSASQGTPDLTQAQLESMGMVQDTVTQQWKTPTGNYVGYKKAYPGDPFYKAPVKTTTNNINSPSPVKTFGTPAANTFVDTSFINPVQQVNTGNVFKSRPILGQKQQGGTMTEDLEGTYPMFNIGGGSMYEDVNTQYYMYGGDPSLPAISSKEALKAFMSIAKKKQGGPSYPGETETSIVDKNKNMFLDYLRTNTDMAFMKNVHEKMYPQMMQPGMNQTGGYNVKNSYNPNAGLNNASMFDMAASQTRDQAGQDFNMFSDDTVNLLDTANPYIELSKAQEGVQVLTNKQTGKPFTKEEYETYKQYFNTPQTTTQTAGATSYPWYQSRGKSFIPINYDPYMKISNKDIQELEMLKNNPTSNLKELDWKKSLFSKNPRKVHMKFGYKEVLQPFTPTGQVPLGNGSSEYVPSRNTPTNPLDAGIKQTQVEKMMNPFNEDAQRQMIIMQGLGNTYPENTAEEPFSFEKATMKKAYGGMPTYQGDVFGSQTSPWNFQGAQQIPDYRSQAFGNNQPMVNPQGSVADMFGSAITGDPLTNYGQDREVDINARFKQGYDREALVGYGIAGANALASAFELNQAQKNENIARQRRTGDMLGAFDSTANRGVWDQFGNFQPDSHVAPLTMYGGSMKGGGEIVPNFWNASQLNWPLQMNKLSTPDTEVRSTLKSVPREEANLEAEGGETAIVNQGGIPAHFKINGPRHTNGGVPLNLPENSFIFSDTKAMKIKDPEILAQFGMAVKKGGYTPAEIAKKYDLNKYRQILADPDTTSLQRKTAEMMIANMNLKLAKLGLAQESKKGFPQGIPAIAMPYIESMSINPADMVNTQAQPEQPDADNMAKFGGLIKAQTGLGFSGNTDKEALFAADAETKDAFAAYHTALKSGDPALMQQTANALEAVDIPYSVGWLPWTKQDKLQDLAGILREKATKRKSVAETEGEYAKKAKDMYNTVYAKYSKAKPGSLEALQLHGDLQTLAGLHPSYNKGIAGSVMIAGTPHLYSAAEKEYLSALEKKSVISAKVAPTGKTANVQKPADSNNLGFNNVAPTPTTTTAPAQKTQSIPDLGKLSPDEIKYMQSKGHKFIANGKVY